MKNTEHPYYNTIQNIFTNLFRDRIAEMVIVPINRLKSEITEELNKLNIDYGLIGAYYVADHGDQIGRYIEFKVYDDDGLIYQAVYSYGTCTDNYESDWKDLRRMFNSNFLEHHNIKI